MIKSELFEKIQSACVVHQLTLCCAESCTGGLFAAQCVNISGASSWFAGGVVSYSNTLKQNLLGVPEQIILEQGAVSSACAQAMAEGGLARCSANACVSVTGIAGPSGGSASKPVGTVFIAVSIDGVGTQTFQYHFKGCRDDIRAQSVNAMAEQLIYCLSSL